MIPIIIWAVIGLCGIAGLLAAQVARSAPEHRPIAFALLATFGAELGRAALVEYVLPSPPTVEPLAGVLRVAAAVDDALFLAWPACVAAVALRVLGRVRAWPVLIAWASVVVALAAAYPLTRGDVLRRCYLAAELVTSFVAVGCLMVHAIRRRRGEETGPRAAPAAAAIMTAGHFGSIVIGPYLLGFWGGAWILALSCNLVIFGALALLYGGIAWKSRKS